MRRVLTAAELLRLHDALEQDRIEVGSVQRFAWRRGWLLPPAHFLPIDARTPLHLAVAVLLVSAVQMPEIAASIFAVTVAAIVIWLFDTPEARKALKPVVHRSVIAAIAVLAFCGWYRWAPPQYWPSVDHLIGALLWLAAVAGLCIAGAVIAHLRQKKWKRRDWQDYVERAISVEAF